MIMANVRDIAERILKIDGPTDAFRLQKLVYYTQAYHLAKHGQPLFTAPIKAWANGPVVPELYQAHKSLYRVSSAGGDPDRLTDTEAQTVQTTLRLYGSHGSKWLVEQTHAEPPWTEARKGLAPKDSVSPRIDVDVMRSYYSKVFNDPEIEELLEDPPGDGLTANQLRQRCSG
jgi:uncharacterized phage-associated protein